jgi:hypothetical protein
MVISLMNKVLFYQIYILYSFNNHQQGVIVELEFEKGPNHNRLHIYFLEMLLT